MIRSFCIVLVLCVAACGGGGGGGSAGTTTPPPVTELDGRLSSSVAFVYSQAEVHTFLASPATGYVEAWFSFPADLAPDIWFGIDQELVEGVDHPRNFAGADWMGLMAFNRNGELGTPVGFQVSHSGTPDDAGNWAIQDLGVTLQPDVWYKIRGIVDFNTLMFTEMQLTGPSVDVVVDLSANLLSYPNYIPLDKPAMTYYVFALRTRELKQPGSTIVYFDDVEGGIDVGGVLTPVYSEGFETQSTAVDIPVTLPVSPLSDITELIVYKEREEALISFSNARQRSGNFALACDVNLSLSL